MWSRTRGVGLRVHATEATSMDKFCQAWSPRLLSVLRIMTALMLLEHGTAKFFGFPHVAAFDNLQFMSLLGAAGGLEIGGGPLPLIGVFTQPVGLLPSRVAPGGS